MSLSDRQRACLDAMGFVPWRHRDRVAAVPATGEALGEIPPAELPAGDVADQSWPDLITSITHCTLCPLHETRTRAVPGAGDRSADWMIIGEAPGVDEDRQGEPFVGRAGHLLNAMLLAVGLQREQVYIANTLKCRPPNNRDPHVEESQRCYPYLRRQIELVRPKLILAVGKVAAQRLLDSDAPVGRLRGTVHRIDPGQVPVVVTYHPAYLLRSPGQKAAAWQDLKLAMKVAS